MTLNGVAFSIQVEFLFARDPRVNGNENKIYLCMIILIIKLKFLKPDNYFVIAPFSKNTQNSQRKS